MSEVVFSSAGRHTVLLLPFDLDRAISDWGALRRRMVADKPDTFTRTEWAYLISFLDPESLESVFVETFGVRGAVEPAASREVVQPGGPVAVWLPNNVSLLGSLTLVLLSLTGNVLRIKSGSRGDDPTPLFLDYARQNLPAGQLRDHLTRDLEVRVFSRDDPQNAEWAGISRTRLVFGSDAAVAAIQALPHPTDSSGFSFGHRESEAWLERGACDDTTLESLLRVFDVYGQAACTSPARVVLLEATPAEAFEIRERLLSIWKRTFPRDPEMAVASTSILDHQWAASLGWSSRLAEKHGAAFAVGSASLPKPKGLRLLPLVPLTVPEAVTSLPECIQTIGYGLSPEMHRELTARIAGRGVKRFVRITEMHRFGPVWDGQSFWRDTFERRAEAAS
jgi:hypothetical protein